MPSKWQFKSLIDTVKAVLPLRQEFGTGGEYAPPSSPNGSVVDMTMR